MRRSIAAVLAVAAVVASPAAGNQAQTPKRGGTVVFGPTIEPPCLNALLSTCGYTLAIEKVLTPAFALAPDLTLKPRLVSGVVVTTKPPFTLTYSIRPEARWSDGVSVTARDFIFTHTAIRKLLSTNPDAVVPQIHDRVQSIRALDSKTFRVVLRSRDAGWRGLFVLVPRHALRGESLETVWSDRIDNPKTGRPIGSGPFLVERWERGKQLTLVRNRNYWGPHPAYLDRLVIRFREIAGGTPLPSEILELLRQGKVDFAESRDYEIVPDLRRLPGIRVVPATIDGWEQLTIRMAAGGHPALRQKLVRRAVAYGVDRVAIVRRLFGVLDPRYRPSDSAVFLERHASYRPNWSSYRYRPTESRRLLEQAGCRRGTDGIYVCAGRRLELRLVTTAGARVRERTIELVQAQLRRVGVEVELSFVRGAVLFSQHLPSGNFDLASFTWLGDAGASGKKNVFGCGSPLNWSGYCQRLLTRDLDQAARILDADERGRVLNRADRQLAKDVPVIPLYEVPTVLAIRKTVRNVVVSPFNFFWNAENWWLER